MVIGLIVCFIGGFMFGYALGVARENLAWKHRYEILEEEYMAEFPENFEEEGEDEDDEISTTTVES